MRDQASKLAHCGNVFYNEWAGKLAELLVGLTGREGGLGWVPGATQKETEGARVFFGSTGTEANEGAFKFARKVSKDRWLAANSSKPESDYRKFRITSFNNAFHGRTMGALSATPNPKYQDPFRPLVPGFDVGVYNGDAESVKTSIGADTCAVIVEPIQGEGGVYAASEEWLRMVRKRCDEVGAVLIFDEIQVRV
jgi:acetylornithine aminotransferase